jgi:hypothetical protein
MGEPTSEVYELKGNRVARVSASEIHEKALNFCDFVGITRKTRFNIATFLEQLANYAICLDPVDDSEWLWFTDGVCDPTKFTILVPESTYTKACNGNEEAIGVIFHEIGHLVLGHKAVLHNEKSAPPCREEDAEWQADEFAARVVSRMGLAPYWQLSLRFE